MGFRYQLRFADGDDAGEGEYTFTPNPGDVIYVQGNREMRVTAVIPTERMEEFIGRPIYDVLEVEPV